MKYDIVLCGVGGQGGISVSVIIAKAAMAAGLQVKQSEVHGMSQRGGEVLAHLRISDKPISSSIIQLGFSDLIIAFEPLEAIRNIPWLSKNGMIVSSIKPVVNISNYPEIDQVLGELKKITNAILVDTDNMAKEVGNLRTSNIILVGAAAKYLPLKEDLIEKAITENFLKKGDTIIQSNIKAFNYGRKFNP